MKKFDIIVIGAGPGGLTVAIGLAKAGKKVALIEKAKIGGDCTNYGCIPSKALLNIAQKSNGVKEALEKTREARQIIVDEESPDFLIKHGIDFISGTAKFIGKCSLSIDGRQEIIGKKIILATGSKANMINIEGLTKNDILTNENIFEQTDDFKKLVIFGGGYIGCELAQAFIDTGISVTLIQRSDKLIPREDQKSIDFMKKYLEKKGVKIFFKTTAKYSKDGKIFLDQDGKEISVDYDKVLISIGRVANTSSLDLEKAGINYDKTGIKVNKYNQTSNKSIYAIGDCVSGNYQFTHWAGNEGRVLVRNILFPFWKKDPNDNIITSCVYTDIEFARTGKIFEELKKLYGKDTIVEYTIGFDKNDKSKITYQTDGFVSIIFKRLSGKILGATIVGKNAGELINIISIAKQNKVSAYKLSNHIFPYPTKSETIKHVADTFVFSTLSNIKNELKTFLKQNIYLLIIGFIWLTIIISFYILKNHYNLQTVDIIVKIYYLLSNNKYGFLLYILLYTVRPLIFIPATLFTLLSGILFGPIGVIITLIGETFSASIAYFMGSIFGNKIIGPESRGLLSDIKNKLKNDSFMPIVILRLAGTPFDLLNYSAGIIKAKFKGFFFGTFFGIIPGATAFVLIGASLNIAEFESIINGEQSPDINYTLLIGGILLFLFSILLAKFVSKKSIKK